MYCIVSIIVPIPLAHELWRILQKTGMLVSTPSLTTRSGSGNESVSDSFSGWCSILETADVGSFHYFILSYISSTHGTSHLSIHPFGRGEWYHSWNARSLQSGGGTPVSSAPVEVTNLPNHSGDDKTSRGDQWPRTPQQVTSEVTSYLQVTSRVRKYCYI